MIAYTHKGSCSTVGCENYGIEFDVISTDGVIGFAICGVCGVDFKENCVPI